MTAADIVTETSTPPPVCPLCDYNLTGIPTPQCPECGHAFEWEELKDPARRAHPYLYEHHRRRPFYSLVKMHLALFKPRSFWQTLRPVHYLVHHRIFTFYFRGLVFLFLLLLLAVTPRAATVLLPPPRYAPHQPWSFVNPQTGKTTPVQMRTSRAFFPPLRTLNGYVPTPLTPVVDLNPPPGQRVWFLSTLFYNDHRKFPFGRTYLRFFRSPGPFAAVFPPLAASAACLTVLLVMRQSSRRAQIRVGHLLRTALYSTDLFFFAVLVALGMGAVYASNYPVGPDHADWYKLFWVACGCAVFSFVRFHFALRYYLPFKHQSVIMGSAAIITFLLVAISING